MTKGSRNANERQPSDERQSETQAMQCGCLTTATPAAEAKRPTSDSSSAPRCPRNCHFADIPSPSTLKRLLKEEGGAAE